jgi:hypothetical protein
MGRITLHCRVLLWLLGACTATAQSSLGDALATVRLLSGLIESRLVRFEAADPDATAPLKVYSVVLTFDGVWWLYTPGIGTRSLGPAPHEHDLATADITARLRRLVPALGRIDVFAHLAPPTTPVTTRTLYNGCFASCLLHLIDLFVRGEPVAEAGVIFLSGETATTPRLAADLGGVGHSLLVYRIADRWRLLDPARPDSPLPFRPPQIGSEIDPDLAAYARRAHYPASRAEYCRFSNAALQRLASDVAWRLFRPLGAPSADR